MEISTSTSKKTINFLEPDRIVNYFGLEQGDHVAEFGAGHGYFTIPMARLVGNDGRIYAIDIQKPTLDVIRAKAKLEHLLNIEIVHADLELKNGSGMKDNFFDFVLMANILFQTESKQILFKEAFRVLRNEGRLGIIEWGSSPVPIGPVLSMRVRTGIVKNLAFDAGFDFENDFDAGEFHYGLIFKKS